MFCKIVIILSSNLALYACFFPANCNGCVALSVAAGAAVGSFIGGVLLTAAIASVVAGVVFFRAKQKFTAKLE